MFVSFVIAHRMWRCCSSVRRTSEVTGNGALFVSFVIANRMCRFLFARKRVVRVYRKQCVFVCTSDHPTVVRADMARVRFGELGDVLLL